MTKKVNETRGSVFQSGRGSVVGQRKGMEHLKGKPGEATPTKAKATVYKTIGDALKKGKYGDIFTTKGADRLYVVSKAKWGKKSTQQSNPKIAKGFSPGSIPSSFKDVKKYSVRTKQRYGGTSNKMVKENKIEEVQKSHIKIFDVNFSKNMDSGIVSKVESGPSEEKYKSYSVMAGSIEKAIKLGKEMLKKDKGSLAGWDVSYISCGQKELVKESRGGRGMGRLSGDQLSRFYSRERHNARKAGVKFKSSEAEKEVARRARTEKLSTIKALAPKKLQKRMPDPSSKRLSKYQKGGD